MARLKSGIPKKSMIRMSTTTSINFLFFIFSASAALILRMVETEQEGDGGTVLFFTWGIAFPFTNYIKELILYTARNDILPKC